MSGAADPPVQGGEFDIDRHGTVEHIIFGPISRVINGVPVGSIRFVAEMWEDGTLFLEYTEQEFREAWGERLFDDPVQIEERRREMAEEADTR